MTNANFDGMLDNIASEPTITVSGHFGEDREVTKAKYTKIWVDHVLELRKVSYTQPWQVAVDDLVKITRIQCHEEFDRRLESKDAS